MATSVAAGQRSGYKFVELGAGQDSVFRENYNVRPFLLRHFLADHPLLQLSHLAKVANRLAEQHPDRLYHDLGQAEIGRGWDYTAERAFPLQEAIRRIETADAWLILKGVQILPEYDELLDGILEEIHDASGRDFRAATHSRNISIIITSPRRITPYHMDADCNYLLQLSGSKTAYVFNGADRSVVTPGELEAFYRGNVNAAKFKQETQAQAWQFELTPGLGVHVPVTFPHWVQNGNSVSISASINFCFVDRTVPDIYRVNHYLRRAGLKPVAPGESALRDGVKKLAAKTLRLVAGRNRQ